MGKSMQGTRSSISPEPSSSPVCVSALPLEPSFLQTLTGSTISTFGSESLGLAHGSFPLRSWQKGMEFSSCGQWEEAIICYTKAISLDPQRVVGPRGLGTRQAGSWEWEAALLRVAVTLASGFRMHLPWH